MCEFPSTREYNHSFGLCLVSKHQSMLCEGFLKELIFIITLKFEIMMRIYDFVFSFFHSFSHIFNSPYWIETNCCFIRKHSCIYSSHHRIENITHFCSSWIWTFHHTLHKLCSHNNRFSIFMSHLSNSSLIYRQLINWQLNP